MTTEYQQFRSSFYRIQIMIIYTEKDTEKWPLRASGGLSGANGNLYIFVINQNIINNKIGSCLPFGSL